MRDKRAKSSGSHENFDSHDTETAPSERNFGTVFTAVFTLLTAHAIWKEHNYWPWTATAAIAVLLITFLRPVWLRPFNRAWTRLGLVLQAITNPVILGAIFYLCVLPMGIVMRLCGRDPMCRKFVAGNASYWVKRSPEQKQMSNMKNQF